MTVGQLRKIVAETKKQDKKKSVSSDVSSSHVIEDDVRRAPTEMVQPWARAVVTAIEDLIEASMSRTSNALMVQALVEGLPHPMREDDIEWFAEEVTRVVGQESYHLNDVMRQMISRTIRKLHKRPGGATKR